MNIDKIHSIKQTISKGIDHEVLHPEVKTESAPQQHLSSHINQIRNSEVPDLSSPTKEEQSATVIKDFMRKVIAAQSYDKMFTRGSYFKSLGQGMPLSEGKASFKALHHLNVLSKHYLQEIKDKTPNLNLQEQHLLSQIVDTKIMLRHQSNAYLAKDGQLTIYSNNKLNSEKVACGNHTIEQDKVTLSNHDFVFFGVEFSEDKRAMPLNLTHMGVDFGANAYLIEDIFPHGYLTLTDHYVNKMPHYSVIEHKEFVSQFPDGIQDVHRKVHADKGEIDIPIYNAKDMKVGLGLHVVNFLRQTHDDKLKAFAFKADLSSKELDRLINFIFQPEFHLPRMLSTTNYTEVKVRDINLKEAILSSNIERLDELGTSKEKISEALFIAVTTKKMDTVKNLLGRNVLTKEDILLTRGGKPNFADLLYTLSDYNADINILRLFLEQDLINVNAQFRFINPGETMLDNAITHGRKDIVTLLRNLGGLREEEL